MKGILSHYFERFKSRRALRESQAAPLNMIKLSAGDHQTFFGYYDKTPFSLDNRFVLGMSLVGHGDLAHVGYFDLGRDNRFEIVGETTTWSWQLGARLQWFPQHEQEFVAYNKLVNGRHGFVVQNIHTGKIEREYTDPVFDISPDGRYAISINFARLFRFREGYGYGNCTDPTEGELCPDDDGIVLLDLEAKTRRILISLRSLCSYHPRPSMENAEHYVNHVLFAPSGKRFMFLHLWSKEGKRYSRAITSDIEAKYLFAIEEESNLSHYAWKSDKELLFHTSKRPSGTKFNLYVDQTGGKKTIGEEVLQQSGHPSYSPDRKRLIVDTYPDKEDQQRLLLCANDGTLIRELGRFYCPKEFARNNKCDLHPRWDRTGSTICIDSAQSGRRAMYLIKLDEMPDAGKRDGGL